MHDYAGALNVFQKLDSESRAQMRAFDQAGEVGDDERLFVRPIAYLDDAEVWLQCGERVVRDLRSGSREPRDQGRLTDIGISDETCIGQQSQLKPVAALFARTAEFMLARSLMGAGR